MMCWFPTGTWYSLILDVQMAEADDEPNPIHRSSKLAANYSQQIQKLILALAPADMK